MIEQLAIGSLACGLVFAVMGVVGVGYPPDTFPLSRFYMLGVSFLLILASIAFSLLPPKGPDR